MTVYLAGMKRLALSNVRESNPIQDAITCTLKVVVVFVVMQKHGWNVHVTRNGKCEVVPLYIAVELVHAGNDAHFGTQLGIHETRFDQVAIAVIRRTPMVKSTRVSGKCFYEFHVATFALHFVLQMESGNNVVQRMAKKMDCLLDKGAVIRDVNLLNSFCGFYSALPRKTPHHEGTDRVERPLGTTNFPAAETLAMRFGKDTVGNIGFTIRDELEERPLFTWRSLNGGDTGFVLDISFEGIVCGGSAIGCLSCHVEGEGGTTGKKERNENA